MKKLGAEQFYDYYRDKRFDYSELANILLEYFDKVDLTENWDETIEAYYIKATYKERKYQIYYRIELMPTEEGKNICVHRFTKYLGIGHKVYYNLDFGGKKY